MYVLTPFCFALVLPAEPQPPASTGAVIGSVTGALIGNELDKYGRDATYAAELLDILNTTKSPQTYLVTLTLLAESNTDPKRIVPTAIRNAERLGIFGKTPALDRNGPPNDLTEPVTAIILKLARGDRTASAPPAPEKSWGGPAKGATADTTWGRVPVFPPIRAGLPEPVVDCCAEPSDKAVLAALPGPARGVPFVFEVSRTDIYNEKERESATLDPARFYPLVGPARAHHSTWKCSVTFTETIASDFPFPLKVTCNRTEVVRLQTTHLHLETLPAPQTSKEPPTSYHP